MASPFSKQCAKWRINLRKRKVTMGTDEPTMYAQRKKQIAEVFDKSAATYDHVGPRFFSHFGRRMVEVAQIPSGSKILDVATGRGAVLFPAAESIGTKGHVIGIDISEKMVQETAKGLVQRKMMPYVEVHQMDAEQLQFPDESFDFVLCGFAIFFFPQLSLAMSEFRRVLKSNGRICITTFEQYFYQQWGWFFEIADTFLPTEPENHSDADIDSPAEPVFDTPEGLKAILDEAGFEDIQILTDSATFVYASEEEFWSTLWSHGVRRTLERIEQEKDAEGLEKFKLQVFKKIGELKQTDGYHQLFPVLFGLAKKPQT
jgi:ubiquinone/menaquinone biosynthesis C-methylase UbiE